ncbi:MAG TPA: redoxin domain-containing protein [Planctomycetota bacterium]|nr:redoxin domain-containing protein [Planctomycetota bacterium]
MIATLTLAALLFAQASRPLDDLIARHTEAVRKAKTFDDISAAAKKTLADIVKFIESKPDSESAARARAIACDICADLEDYEGAEAHAKAFFEGWPKHAQASLVRMNLGQIRLAAGQDAKAREAFESMIHDTPKESQLFEAKLRIAQSYLCEGRDDVALKSLVDLRAANKGKPEEWAAVLQQSLFLQISGKPGEGRALLEETVRSCPDEATVEFAKQVLATWLWIGKPAKPAEGWNVKGEAVKLDLTGGKVTVLYFLGTAFPDYPVEAGVMRRLARRFPASDVSILAIAIDKEKAKLEAELPRAGVTWPVIHDGNGFKGPIASAYGIDNLPMVFVIDRKNVVRYVNPIFSDHARDIGRCVEKLVAEK